MYTNCDLNYLKEKKGFFFCVPENKMFSFPFLFLYQLQCYGLFTRLKPWFHKRTWGWRKCSHKFCTVATCSLREHWMWHFLCGFLFEIQKKVSLWKSIFVHVHDKANDFYMTTTNVHIVKITFETTIPAPCSLTILSLNVILWHNSRRW